MSFRKLRHLFREIFRLPHLNAGPEIKYYETETGNFYLVHNDALARYIISGEPHEPHFNLLTQRLLRDNDNVLDLGANIGTHTLWMSRLVMKGEVFAFEPLSLTFSQLQMNLIANKVTNAHAYKLAVSDRTGELIRMQAINYDASTVNVGATRVSAGAGGDATLAIRLDDLDLPRIAFIKMDIQGSQTSALQGMERLLERDRPLIFVEIEEKHLRACGSSSKELMEDLLGKKYTLFRIMTDYPCDHLAVPEEKIAEIEPILAKEFSFRTEKIKGDIVDLKFDESEYTYSSITVR